MGLCSGRDSHPYCHKTERPSTSLPFRQSTTTLGPAPSFLSVVPVMCIGALQPLSSNCWKKVSISTHVILKRPLSMLSHVVSSKAFLLGDALLQEKVGGPRFYLPVLNSVSMACLSYNVSKASTCKLLPSAKRWREARMSSHCIIAVILWMCLQAGIATNSASSRTPHNVT